ncbi:iron-sulfur cluster assembly scaffold protein [Desulforhopalus sp. IMCC35007]|nr:iron-sulfur cluster assembly scaffold protein [Desulforhopalus sp. IMCC35007]
MAVSMSLLSIGVAFLVLLVVALTWFFIYYYANPVLDAPDGIAKVVGNCGDTMEIALKFKDGHVAATQSWTNGCSFSKHCVEAAALLAKNKTVDELKKINMISIMDVTGTLPETHLHCAQLAEITLQRCVENYLEGGTKAGGTMS